MTKRDKAEESKSSQDVALIHGVTDDGDLKILRQREDRLELGAIRPLREGVPISGEVVRLTPRKECPLICDVTTELKAPPSPADSAPAPSLGHKGPARVTNDRYRTNWDQIWSRPKSDERMN
jgi:hypothetical protein